MTEVFDFRDLLPERLFSLEGQNALVIGAGGLGHIVGLGLAASGADVVVADLDSERAATVAKSIERVGRKSLAFCVDVTVKSSVQRLVTKVAEVFGRINVLVNATGITRLAPAEQYAEEDWDQILAVNLKGVFLTSQAVGLHMIAAGGGAIVNFSSIAGQVGLIRTPAYCASKGGVDQLTRALALEWVGYGVRVNAVAPSWFETAMGRSLDSTPGLYEERISRVPMHRVGHPKEIVGAVVFLASPAASMVTGTVLAVDGGYLAQ